MPKIKVKTPVSSQGLQNLNSAPLASKQILPQPISQFAPISNAPIAKNSILESFDKGKGAKAINKKEYDFGEEMIGQSKKQLPYDNQTASQLVKQVSSTTGIKPSLLYSSAYIEGMNKAVAKPDDISEAYDVNVSEDDKKTYPVDGFYNYGLDTFGDKYDQLKKYLPVGFETRFKTFEGTNERNQPIKTAAFKTNKDALIAKSAFLKLEQDNVSSYAKSKGINLDEDAKDYFTMASYNGGFGSAKKMIDEYSQAKDKKSFIDKGETSLKGVHKNIDKRMKLRNISDKIMSENN